MTKARKNYPNDVSEEEWAFCAPYLTLMKEDAPEREHPLRKIFNGLGWFVRAGLPVADDAQRSAALARGATAYAALLLRAGYFEAMAEDLRLLLRLAAGRHAAPSAATLDSRTLQSSPDSGARAGYDGATKRKGSKGSKVDALGHLLALKVTPANEQDRAQVKALAQAVQATTGQNVELAYADQGYTDDQPAADAAAHGVKLEAVKHHEAKRGFVLLPRRWVVERTFAWAARLRRLARDYERLAITLAGYHWLAEAILMLKLYSPKVPDRL